MSKEEKEELSALVEWLSSFPQLEHFPFDKENGASLVDYTLDYLSTSGITRYVCSVDIGMN